MENKNEKQCDVCMIPDFERNNYFHGKLMTVRDFFAEQCYFNEKRWLINRTVNGWGVVCGLDVVARNGKVFVTPGLAIDCCGREILVCEEREVEMVPQESHCEKLKQEKPKEEKKLIICLEFFECKTEPISLPPIACDQKEKCEFNRIRDSFKITVLPYYEQESQREPFCPQTKAEKEKNFHQYLCDKLRQEGCPECPEPPCIILAIVTLNKDGNLKGEPDHCSRRRLVYNNPLLYDLIHCFHGDLAHVIDMNWQENGAQIKWQDFEDGIYNKGLTVCIDKKMTKDTINKNTFLFLVKMEDADTGNSAFEQIPGTVSSSWNKGQTVITFEIDSAWLMDVYFGYSRIREKGGEFMVVLKSDFIMSVAENGKPAKALDGNFIGGELPSGNGTQGGDFVSWFSVEPKPEETSRKRRAK
jgi:hypothetical protein